MKEENNVLETKLKNLTYIMLMGFLIIIMLLIGLYFKGSTDTKTTTTNPSGSSSGGSSSAYDVSKMNKITGSDAAKLFDNKKETQILYIGRPGCGVCVSLVPELNKVITDLNIKINYLELDENFRTDFADLFKHLTIETKLTSGGKTYEGTYGELLNEGGFTPMVIIIKDGKMADGFIGSRTSDTIKTLFQKYL